MATLSPRGKVGRRGAAGPATTQGTNVGIMFVNNVVERGLTFLSVAVVLRVVGTADGGRFSLMLKVAGVAILFATLGVQAAAVRLVSGAFSIGDDIAANALLRAFFMLRASLGLLVMLVAWPLAPGIARGVLHQASAAPFIRLAAVATGVNAVGSFGLHHLQARQLFGRYAAVNVGSTVVRTAVLLGMAATHELSAFRAGVIWVVAAALGAVGAIAWAPREFLHRGRLAKDAGRAARRDLTRYGRWLVVAALANGIFFNADSLLIARYRDLQAVGTYGAAFTLAQGVYLAIVAATAVMLPHVARMRSVEELRSYYRRTIRITGALALALAPLALASRLALRVLYGSQYASGGSVLAVLYLAALLPLIYDTASVAIFALDRPRLVAAVSLLQLGIGLPAYLGLIPRYGMMGGAVGTLLGHLAAFAFVMISVPRALEQARRPHVGVEATRR